MKNSTIQKRKQKEQLFSCDPETIDKILYYCGYKIVEDKIVLKAIGKSESYAINEESIKIVYKDIQKWPIFGMQKEQKALTLEDLERRIVELEKKVEKGIDKTNEIL